jgi:hypothetical protein
MGDESPTSILTSVHEDTPTPIPEATATPTSCTCPCSSTPDAADSKFIPTAKIWVNESALGEIVHEFKMRAALREWLEAKGA